MFRVCGLGFSSLRFNGVSGLVRVYGGGGFTVKGLLSSGS